MRPQPEETPEDSQRLLADRYRLDRQIARGGMAEVWLGFDTFLDREVAIKVLKPHLATDPILAERFRREALACAGLNHPNIVAVYDSVEDNGRQAVVMQYIEGKSLRELLDRRKRLRPLVTIHIGIAMAGALDFAHRSNLVHRDVKPGNILVTPDGRFLLADFGIAKALTVVGEDLTHDNIMMGTAKYLAPEQVRGKPLDGRADLYGLGLVMYECLAGKVPFLGETDADTALARLQREPTDLSHLRPELAPELVRVIHKLMARQPEHRYATGQETADALTQAIDAQNNHTTSLTPPTGSASQKPHAPLNQVVERKERPVVQTEQVQELVVDVSKKVKKKSNKKVKRSSSSSGRRVPHTTKFLTLVAVLLSVAVMYVATNGIDTSSFPFIKSSNALNPGDGSLTISRVMSFDPNGGDGLENESGVWALNDGDPKTGWSTDCYANQFFGDKKFVGVIVQLSQASKGILQVGMQNGPWSLEIYTARDSAPNQLDQWGAQVGADYNTRRGVAQFVVAEQAQFVLVLLREIGMSEQCSQSNPYQGLIQDISFSTS